MTWRHLSFVLAALCAIQTWRACNRPSTPTAPVETAECAQAGSSPRARSASSHDSQRNHASANDDSPDPAPSGPSINGFKLPAWTMWLAPQPGESLLSYRDRMLPLAQAAVAPHRARVARGRDDFAKLVNLDSQQRAQLDTSVQEAASAIQDKVIGSLMSGDLNPSTFKPMTGVALAREVFTTIDQANQRFVGGLREDQRAKLAQHPFDFADYLLFSARWEDALGITN